MRPLPPPITKLTLEQEFLKAKLLKSIESSDKETMLEAVEHLLTHNFLLKSTVLNLLSKWDEPDTKGALLPEERSPS